MPELLSLKDRLKLFEKEIDDQQKVPEPKKDRKFSFLSDDDSSPARHRAAADHEKKETPASERASGPLGEF